MTKQEKLEFLKRKLEAIESATDQGHGLEPKLSTLASAILLLMDE